MSDLKQIIVALDFATLPDALALAERLSPEQCRMKVGKELYTRAGPAALTALVERGFEVFLDLKFHDIPHTVAGACRAAADLGCWMVNVHASGGSAMLEAACESIARRAPRPLLTAVTVLTSLDAHALHAVGVPAAPREQVARLAGLAHAAGVDGVVCSPLEIEFLRARVGADFILVVPGVRPHGAAHDDQTRVATPANAIAAGADFLVVGRPVTQSADPAVALAAISAECTRAE